METLSYDIYNLIFTHCDFDTLRNIKGLSKSFYSLVTDKQILSSIPYGHNILYESKFIKHITKDLDDFFFICDKHSYIFMLNCIIENGLNDLLLSLPQIFPNISISQYSVPGWNPIAKENFIIMNNGKSTIIGSSLVLGIIAREGMNETLMIVKNLFPNLSYDCLFDFASRGGQNDTLLFINKEFPEVRKTSWAFDWAAENGHNNTLLLLKNKFPEIQGTSEAYKRAFENRHMSTVFLLLQEFPDLYDPINIFNLAAHYGCNDILIHLKQIYPNIKFDTNQAFLNAIEKNHKSTLALLRNEFSEDGPSTSYDVASRNRVRETIIFLRLQFPKIKLPFGIIEEKTIS